MANDCSVLVLFGKLDGVESFGERADLIDLHQDRIGDALFDALAQEGDVGDKNIIAHQLHLVAQRVGKKFPAFPVILGAPVLNGDDGVFAAKLLVIVDQFFSRALRSVGLLEDIGLLRSVVEFARCGIEGNEDLLAELVSGGLDRIGDLIERVVGG